MSKEEFLAALENGICGLPKEEIEERLAFYGEMIEDLKEDGLTEEEAVAGIGTPEEVILQIAQDVPVGKIVRHRVRSSFRPKAWEIVLIVLGFPVWFPLLAAAFAVAIALYIALWAVIVSLWAVDFSLAVASVGGIALAVAYVSHGFGLPAVAMTGVAVMSGGASIFLFFGCLYATKGLAKLTKKAVLGFKRKLIGKEAAK